MTRREAREAAFGLIFECEFKKDEQAKDIFDISVDNREIEEDDYIKAIYFGVAEHKDELDGVISRHAHGWKPERLSGVSRTVLRMGVYEMLFMNDIPRMVSLNEAIELAKKFDEEKAGAFVNGVLNAVMKECDEAPKN